MIRDFESRDFDALSRIFKESGLPQECLPDVGHPLFLVKKVYEEEGHVALIAATKLTAEQYLLVDHAWKTPDSRWSALRQLRDAVVSDVDSRGLQDLTLWAPPQVEKSFGKRLQSLGFTKSPWPSYSLIL